MAQKDELNGYKRLPNGFGNISYLGEGRRRPYIARKNGEIIGYFETWSEAFQELSKRSHSGTQKKKKKQASLPSFIAAFASKNALTEEDIRRIREIIDSCGKDS